MSDVDGALPLAGVELGGTKCICTLGHGPDAILAQEMVATTTPDGTLAAIAAILARWWQAQRFAALGIASFGPLDLDPASPAYGHILATTKPGWAMADVAGRLAAQWPVKVVFDTDVNGAALAECAWGVGRGLDDFAYVTVGTGVGVGLIVHGRPTRGLGHSELGHLRVPRLVTDTAPSGCPFHPDCVEGLAAGIGIAAALGGREIGEVPAGDPLWDRVTHALAMLCHALVCGTAPRRIAIGGGVIERQPHLLPRIAEALAASLNAYVAIPQTNFLVRPALGDQAGPLGAIALARRSLT
ncbi:ROK family protein [Sphingomonas sanxanigenens]|uniref:ROK family protein n=1 Tax=Sphingomonas sanxanigenens TaxID=397260 RepID=UPI00063D257F